MKNNEAKMLAKLFEAKIAFPENMNTMIKECLTLRRLALKHHRLAEYDCNGEGYILGQFIRLDGSNPKAYVDADTSIFTAVSDKIEAKINAICDRLGFRVEFQGDPRGYTVKIFKGDR